jgi:hypothetical protein
MEAVSSKRGVLSPVMDDQKDSTRCGANAQRTLTVKRGIVEMWGEGNSRRQKAPAVVSYRSAVKSNSPTKLDAMDSLSAPSTAVTRKK